MKSEKKPTRADVEAAFKTIIRWSGDDPTRDGLKETPARLARAYEEYFRGYDEDPEAILKKTSTSPSLAQTRHPKLLITLQRIG